MQPFCGLPLTRILGNPNMRHPLIEWMPEGQGIPVVFDESEAWRFIAIMSPVCGIRGIASFTPHGDFPLVQETIRVGHGDKFVLRKAPLDVSRIALDGKASAYARHLENAIELSLRGPVECVEADGKWTLVTYILEAAKASAD